MSAMYLNETNVSNSNPWLTFQSAPSSIVGPTVYRKTARGDRVCFEADSDETASLTSQSNVKTLEMVFFI